MLKSWSSTERKATYSKWLGEIKSLSTNGWDGLYFAYDIIDLIEERKDMHAELLEELDKSGFCWDYIDLCP